MPRTYQERIALVSFVLAHILDTASENIIENLSNNEFFPQSYVSLRLASPMQLFFSSVTFIMIFRTATVYQTLQVGVLIADSYVTLFGSEIEAIPTPLEAYSPNLDVLIHFYDAVRIV